MTSGVIYLDHQATTPLDPSALKAMMPFLTTEFGNAASVDHEFGLRAAKAVDRARSQVARLIGATSEEIIFTSGATEANNLALFGTMGSDVAGKHVICGATEHPSVLDAVGALRAGGASVSVVAVDGHGRVDPINVQELLRPSTALVSVMLANNEVGTIAPLREIADLVHSKSSALVHSDATQAVGHIPVSVRSLGVDLLSISAHKMYGPKGVGALFARASQPRVHLRPLMWGGGHERGMRSGTLNVPGIVGFGQAAQVAAELMPVEAPRMRDLRDLLQERLLATTDVSVYVNGHPAERLPHNLNVTLRGIEAKALIVAVKEVAFSTGSACSTARVELSHVLLAMGLPEEDVHSSIRLGLGRSTDREAAIRAADALREGIRRLSRLGPRLSASRG